MQLFNKQTPVLFIIFNRPDTTEKVFEQIRKAQPKYLYIAADGPRNEAEKTLCNKTREVVSIIDWDCEVKHLYSDHNLGCGIAVSKGITWFFDNVEQGIVLEDDCLPSNSFWGFCSLMLEKYKNDDRIGHITGGNYQNNIKRGNGSYYFSALTNVWGWAGWRRIWKDYDIKMPSLPLFKELNYIHNSETHASFKTSWMNALDGCYEGKINTWDYQYAYLNLINNRLSIIPNKNLISNIGFGNNATHTKGYHPFSSLPLTDLDLENITHPTFIMPDFAADTYFQEIETGMHRKNLISRLKHNVRYAIKMAYKGKLITHKR